MTASSRGSRAVSSLLKPSRNPRVCSDCISSFSQPRRHYADAAAQSVKPKEGLLEQGHAADVSPITRAATAPFTLKSGILLSRPPLLTRKLTPFENAFYFYQKRLNERLALPFTRYFYFKKDTPGDHDWKRKAKERNGVAAKELGGYQAYGEWAWNDEVLVGDKLSEPRSILEALVKDAEMTDEDGVVSEESTEMPLERYTEADTKMDYKRLDRRLARTLYLCVKGEAGGWVLPSGPIVGRENLLQAAERILVQSAGPNMNTWIVGHAPVGHVVVKPRYAPDATIERSGEKTFFMKGRIMTGQANLKNNLFGLQDFKWLTREELQRHVGPGYFSLVKNMLADR